MLADAAVLPTLVASDIERAKEFYVDKLGLKSLDLPGMPENSAIFGCGDGTELYMYQRPGGSRAEHTVAAWHVDDIEAAVAELRNRGITFEQYEMAHLKTDEPAIADDGTSRSAWFKDSEGNTLAISEY